VQHIAPQAMIRGIRIQPSRFNRPAGSVQVRHHRRRALLFGQLIPKSNRNGRRRK
jgi:hypothetical protein